jgi:C-terminal processing protease CtpA/Prc
MLAVLISSCSKEQPPAPPPSAPPKQVSKPPPPPATNQVAAAPAPVKKTVEQEILQILEAQYADPALLNSQKLNQAAVEGMLKSLDESAVLIDPADTKIKAVPSKRAAVNSSTPLDLFIAYIRLEKIEKGVASTLAEEIKKLQNVKRVESFIIDLRFAHGTDYAAIPPIVSLFLEKKAPLFSINRGKTVESFEAEAEALTQAPLVLLINEQTSGAPEVLAACLRSLKRAVIIGHASSAGEAFETSEIKLSNGKILKFATGKVVLNDKQELFLKGVKPDVLISMDSNKEKEIFEKPFQAPNFRVETRSYSEAILTGRESLPPIPKEKNKKDATEPATNQDTVLIGAIDLLKSIQALHLLPKQPENKEELKEQEG